jgi:hypothetical protein
VRRAWILLSALVLAGCGGTLGTQHHTTPAATRALQADGIGVDLPDGWSGRILLGASGRPVLHAASFPLPPGDDDSGEIAKESMGRDIYLNVRDLGHGDSPVAFPVTFSASDFGPPPPGPGSMCCRISEASRDVSVSGELYRITAISGGEAPPGDELLGQANDVLASLSLAPYTPEPIPHLPGDAEQIEGYGISMELPPGWKGSVTRGRVEASTAGLRLSLRENGGTDAQPFVTGRTPIRLSTAEFVGPSGGFDPKIVAMTGRSFVEQGRTFVLDVVADALPPRDEVVTEANEALATLKVEAGDFYPGTVDPATFAEADGWHTGDTGPAKMQPDGEQTISWASTIPYKDSGFQFPPHATQDALPPDGIAIVVMLSQSGPHSNGPDTSPRLDLAGATVGTFEGMDPSKQTRMLTLHAHNYGGQIWVMFGQEHPTADQVDRAQAELDRLQLPSWPPY